jgi:outer membrane protein TolC
MHAHGCFASASTLATGLILVAAAGLPARARAETGVVTDEQLARGVDRATVVQAALARSPKLKAQADRVRATRTMSSAEGRLPDPEAMFQIWQVPFQHPASFSDAQMIMAGVTQAFPAPGSLSAMSESKEHAAAAEEAMLADRARDVVRDAENTYSDLEEGTARHKAHLEHRGVAERLVRAAEARQGAAGSLDDVMQAQLELARLDVDLATEASAVGRAKTHLNALLGRPLDAPVGPVRLTDAMTVAIPPESLVALAERVRPDLRAADARVASEGAALQSAQREATWPSFSVGAYYFAPTNLMPFNGYGASATMSLPWVWGGNDRKRESEEALTGAARHDVQDARLNIAVDVGTAAASVRSATERLRVLKSVALPAARRVLDVALASYQGGGGGMLGVLRAQQAVVDIEIDIVMARAQLDHALSDLDWAVGMPLPRTSLAE